MMMMKQFVLAAAIISASEAFYPSQTTTIIHSNSNSYSIRTRNTAISATEDATRKPGQYLPTNKRYADHLMQSESFRSSLSGSYSPTDSSTFPHPLTEDWNSEYDTELEMQLIRDKGALSRILESREYKSSLDNIDTEDDVDFTEEMFVQQAALADLMHSDKFRHSLDVDNSEEDDDDHHYHATSSTTTTQDEIIQQEEHPQEFDIQNNQYNREMIHQQADLNKFMKHTTELITRQQEFDSSLEMVMARGALADVLSSTAFRSSLHPNQEAQGDYNMGGGGGGLMHTIHNHNDVVEMGGGGGSVSMPPSSNLEDAHLHTLLVGEDDEEGMIATDYDFDLAMLRGKAALERVMSGRFHHHRHV